LDKYSYKQWKTIEEVIGQGLIGKTGEPGTMTLNYINIIYKKKPRITGKYENDKTIEQTVIYIIQELKRDIYSRAQKTNRGTEIRNIQRYAHIKTLLKKSKSYLDYKGQGGENVPELFKNMSRVIEEKIQAASDD